MRSSQPAIRLSDPSPAMKPGMRTTGRPSPCGTPRPWKTGSTVRRASSACQRSSWTWRPHHTPCGSTGPAMAESYVNAACRRGARDRRRATLPRPWRPGTTCAASRWRCPRRASGPRELRQWRVKDKLFTWERPLRRADREALGDAAPEGPILGVRVEHLGAKEALLASDPAVFFTTPHFDGYAAVLVRLERIDLGELEDVIVEAWLSRAPKRLAQAYVDAR